MIDTRYLIRIRNYNRRRNHALMPHLIKDLLVPIGPCIHRSVPADAPGLGQIGCIGPSPHCHEIEETPRPQVEKVLRVTALVFQHLGYLFFILLGPLSERVQREDPFFAFVFFGEEGRRGVWQGGISKYLHRQRCGLNRSSHRPGSEQLRQYRNSLGDFWP